MVAPSSASAYPHNVFSVSKEGDTSSPKTILPPHNPAYNMDSYVLGYYKSEPAHNAQPLSSKEEVETLQLSREISYSRHPAPAKHPLQNPEDNSQTKMPKIQSSSKEEVEPLASGIPSIESNSNYAVKPSHQENFKTEQIIIVSTKDDPLFAHLSQKTQEIANEVIARTRLEIKKNGWKIKNSFLEKGIKVLTAIKVYEMRYTMQRYLWEEIRILGKFTETARVISDSYYHLQKKFREKAVEWEFVASAIHELLKKNELPKIRICQ